MKLVSNHQIGFAKQEVQYSQRAEYSTWLKAQHHSTVEKQRLIQSTPSVNIPDPYHLCMISPAWCGNDY